PRIVGAREWYASDARKLDRHITETVIASYSREISVEQRRLVRRVIARPERGKVPLHQQCGKAKDAALIRRADNNPAAGFYNPDQLANEGPRIFQMLDRFNRDRDIRRVIRH